MLLHEHVLVTSKHVIKEEMSLQQEGEVIFIKDCEDEIAKAKSFITSTVIFHSKKKWIVHFEFMVTLKP